MKSMADSSTFAIDRLAEKSPMGRLTIFLPIFCHSLDHCAPPNIDTGGGNRSKPAEEAESKVRGHFMIFGSMVPQLDKWLKFKVFRGGYFRRVYSLLSPR